MARQCMAGSEKRRRGDAATLADVGREGVSEMAASDGLIVLAPTLADDASAWLPEHTPIVCSLPQIMWCAVHSMPRQAAARCRAGCDGV
jgi:hypothetical protein